MIQSHFLDDLEDTPIPFSKGSLNPVVAKNDADLFRVSLLLLETP
jgi:hypothetical protein